MQSMTEIKIKHMIKPRFKKFVERRRLSQICVKFISIIQADVTFIPGCF